MGKIVGIIIMLICLFQGLKHFGIIGPSEPTKQNKKSQKAYGDLLNNWGNKTKTTNQLEGQVKNINQIRPQDLQAELNQEMRNKFPDISRVFGVDNSRWIVSLSEEDFTILREIKGKLDNGNPITEEDDNRYRILEGKGIIDAIRQNNPGFNQPSPGVSDSEPGAESDVVDESYGTNDAVDENSAIDTEVVPMIEEEPEPLQEEPEQGYPQDDTQFNND